MPTKLPRVLGLEQLLRLRKTPSERPEPLVYFSDQEFKRLLKSALELDRKPRGPGPRPTFEPWPSGGMVPGKCESPPGQICWGRWTVGPAGGGLYFGCRCRRADGGIVPLPKQPCTIGIDAETQTFRCIGECAQGQGCKLGFYRDPQTRIVTLDCRCRRSGIVVNP